MSADMMRLHDWDSFTLWEPTDNDLPPTEPDEWDYDPYWDTEQDWVHPHPDMEGRRCSSGWHHVAYQRSPVPAVGLARLPASEASDLGWLLEWMEDDE